MSAISFTIKQRPPMPWQMDVRKALADLFRERLASMVPVA